MVSDAKAWLNDVVDVLLTDLGPPDDNGVKRTKVTDDVAALSLSR